MLYGLRTTQDTRASAPACCNRLSWLYIPCIVLPCPLQGVHCVYMNIHETCPERPHTQSHSPKQKVLGPVICLNKPQVLLHVTDVRTYVSSGGHSVQCSIPLGQWYCTNSCWLPTTIIDSLETSRSLLVIGSRTRILWRGVVPHSCSQVSHASGSAYAG